MNDPKYEIRDGALWHKAGNYRVPDDEPVMVLRGKDPTVLQFVRMYLDVAPDEAHREAARRWIDMTDKWQRDNPSRVKVGCHNC